MSTIRRLYKNQKAGVLFGVCAGLADYFNLNVAFIRLIFLFPFLPFWLAYMIRAAILVDKSTLVPPLDLDHALEKIQTQLEQTEHTLIRLETYITSDDFDFHRRLWD
jgi:phage shock protein C